MNNNTYVDEVIHKRNKYVGRSSNTGHKGVFHRRNKYESYFSFALNGYSNKLHLGTYSTLKEAVAARNKFIDSLK